MARCAPTWYRPGCSLQYGWASSVTKFLVPSTAATCEVPSAAFGVFSALPSMELREFLLVLALLARGGVAPRDRAIGELLDVLGIRGFILVVVVEVHGV